MDAVSSNDTALQAAVARAPEAMRFTGRGSEYFGIWIVNLLLTILTLGIYSAWAKVRRLQYFYRHTELAGSSFDFHGSPLRILVGRLIAVAMLILYNYSVRMRSPWLLAVVLAAALAAPLLLRNSFRFRLYNTSWRGMRFHFRGSLGGAYRVFLLNGFFTLITGYLLAPFMQQRLKAYQHGNSWFGRTQFSFHARASQFYRIYLGVGAATAVILVFVLSFGGLGHALMTLFQPHKPGAHVDTWAIVKAVATLYGTLILLGVSMGPILQALVTNLIWNNTRLGPHRIECKISPWTLIWITASNLTLVVLTLGAYIPWAMVRLVKYRLECVRLLPATDLQEFVAADTEEVGALGEEAAAVFDLDIAL